MRGARKPSRCNVIECLRMMGTKLSLREIVPQQLEQGSECTIAVLCCDASLGFYMQCNVTGKAVRRNPTATPYLQGQGEQEDFGA